MFAAFTNIFRRRRARSKFCEPVRLAIEGIAPSPLTPEPDDAELAAEALLEQTLSPLSRKANKPHRSHKTNKTNEPAAKGSPDYYKALAARICTAHGQELRGAMRFVAYCEETLSHKAHEAHKSHELAELERGLFKHQRAVEREGGDLLRRWQHCLAEVIVRQMEDPPPAPPVMDGRNEAEIKQNQTN